MKYVLHWKYWDGSAHGVLRCIFTEAQKDWFEEHILAFLDDRCWNFVEVEDAKI